VGTGMSVGDEGGACDIGAEAEPIGPEPTGPEPGGTTSTPTISSRVGVVGDGISVGTGMSVGVAGTGNEPERTERNAVVLPVALPVALARASAVAVTLALRGTGTSPRASGPVGDEGDGNSVGTGISVGEEGGSPELKAAEPNAAEACPNAEGGLTNSRTCSERERTMDVEPSVGDPGTSTAGASPSSGARDVGEGTSVGTGISVGEDAGSPEPMSSEETPEDFAASGGTSVGTSVGKGAPRSQRWPAGGGCNEGTTVAVGATVGNSTASVGDGAAEVGDGASVGTGISVGEVALGVRSGMRPCW